MVDFQTKTLTDTPPYIILIKITRKIFVAELIWKIYLVTTKRIFLLIDNSHISLDLLIIRAYYDTTFL